MFWQAISPGRTAVRSVPPLRSGLLPAALPVVCLLLASCGSGEEGGVPVYPVTGKVQFGSEVPVGAQIVLHPQGHTLPPNLTPMGTVANDGTFTISSYGKGDGAPAGNYKATLQWFKLVSGKEGGGSGRGPNVFPRSYSDPAKTPVEITVAAGNNTISPIEVKR